MSSTESSDTLSQVINRLRQRGYTDDLNRRDNNPLWLDPAAYHIDAVYRFEAVRRCGDTNPDDESILYALSSERYGAKGVLVNGYGLAADADTAGIEARLARWPDHQPKSEQL